MPPPILVTRRGEAKSSIVSAISSRLRTSWTPNASNTASKAPCSPASAPECAVTIAFDDSERPTFRATTGTPASAACASAATNPDGDRTVSSSNPSTRVDRRPSAYSMYASIVVTISCPLETTRLNPIPRSLKARAANAEPEWEMNVTGPGRMTSGVAKPVARRFASTFRKPMPLPPHSAIPCSRAIAATRSARDGPPDASSYNEENVTTLAAPASAASRIACSIRAFATPRIARSTGSGTSRREGKQGCPSTSS